MSEEEVDNMNKEDETTEEKGPKPIATTHEWILWEHQTGKRVKTDLEWREATNEYVAVEVIVVGWLWWLYFQL